MKNPHQSYLVALSVFFLPAVATAQNVGIGTSSPTERLHVYRATGNTIVAVQSVPAASFSALEARNADGVSDFTRFGSNTGSTVAGINTNNATRLWSSVGSMIIGTSTTNNLHFATAATERMVITDQGNVGIGVPNPIGMLEVQGDNLTETSVRFKSASNFGIRQWFMMGNNLNTALVIARFGPDFGGSSFGIPNQNLSAIYTSDVGLNALAIGTKNSIPLVFGTNNQERARIQGDGNMGIGTAMPSGFAQLHAKRPGTWSYPQFNEIGAIFGENGNPNEGSGVFGVSNAPKTGGSLWAGVTGINLGVGSDRYGVFGFSYGTSSGDTYTAGVGGLGDYGVYGYGYTTGVLAEHINGGTSLELKNGFFKVSGSDRTAFKHTTSVGNIISNYSFLTYRSPNENDIVIVTHNFSPKGTYLNKAVGVFWDAGGSRWCVYNEDLSAMPTNITFNVLIIKQ